MENSNIVYEKYKKIINNEVWRGRKRIRCVDKEDALSEANEVFSICLKKWDHHKSAKFPTYLTQALRNNFSPLTWSRYHKQEPDGDYDPEKVGLNGMCSPERLVRLKEALSGMQSLAIQIVNLVFSPPAALQMLMEEMGKPIPTKEVLRNYMRKNLGIYDAKTISDIFAEITQTLEEV